MDRSESVRATQNVNARREAIRSTAWLGRLQLMKNDSSEKPKRTKKEGHRRQEDRDERQKTEPRK